MNNSDFTEVLSKFKKEHAGAEKLSALSDREMAKVAGGLGGENEATCSVCGKPMRVSKVENGETFWRCDACKIEHNVSDAEYIALIDMMESFNCPVEYPIWWPEVKKK